MLVSCCTISKSQIADSEAVLAVTMEWSNGKGQRMLSPLYLLIHQAVDLYFIYTKPDFFPPNYIYVNQTFLQDPDLILPMF